MHMMIFLFGFLIGGLSQVWFVRWLKSTNRIIFKATPKLLGELNIKVDNEETPFVKLNRRVMPKDYCDAITPQYMKDIEH